MKRFHLFVSGIVQGVGFRWYTRDICRNLGLGGWVKNLSNGNVEIVVEGEEDLLNEFLLRLKDGYLGKNIEKIDITEEEYKGEFKDFGIKF